MRRPSLHGDCRRGAGPAGKGNTPCVLSGNCCRGDGGRGGGCQGDGGCLSDPSPPVLSPALLMPTAAQHCGSAGGRAERTTVNEFRRNGDSPFALSPLWCSPSPLITSLCAPLHFSWVSVLYECALRMGGPPRSIMTKCTFPRVHTHTHRSHVHPPPPPSPCTHSHRPTHANK